MDIFVRKSYKMVQPFVLKDLPDFIVLTGENGTGKTQLLEYLYEASHFTDDGFFIKQMKKWLLNTLFLKEIL